MGYNWFYIFMAMALAGGYLSFGAISVVHPSVLEWCQEQRFFVSVCLGAMVAIVTLCIFYGLLVPIYLLSVPLGVNAAAAMAVRK